MNPNIRDNAPIWMRENRAPTRAELAAKHFADGGGMAPSVDNALPADDGETELVRLGDTNIFVRKPKAVPADTGIKVRRFNK